MNVFVLDWVVYLVAKLCLEILFERSAYRAVLIGESLGAHVAANAAQAVEIVRPFTQNIKTLHKQDANFVDIYHTNRGLLGTTSDAGHVNVYVNGGTSQPGCLRADFTGLMGSN
ncbi:Pancreatic lipase-related protein 3 [Orchesella cincta]|uniref:Pancreatic lipase-related protein 3 n=1 Tax=Orchesella cincta TaxID=48709 RepID=A0A1D2ME03_ORCCI|nr:Pancreatic lipase-related protein 3 [Orchesella cincta]